MDSKIASKTDRNQSPLSKQDLDTKRKSVVGGGTTFITGGSTMYDSQFPMKSTTSRIYQ